MRRCLTAAIGLGMLLTACDDGAVSGQTPDAGRTDGGGGDVSLPADAETDRPNPDEIGVPCNGPDDCDSRLCLATEVGGRCTVSCADDPGICIAGWSCEASVVFGGPVCQPDEGTLSPPGGLCDPCAGDDDCGGPDDQCLPLGGQGGQLICARSCADEACPAGYECRSIGLGRQCLPIGDACPDAPTGGLRLVSGQFLSTGGAMSTDRHELRLTLGGREPIHPMRTEGPLRLRLRPISLGRTP